MIEQEFYPALEIDNSEADVIVIRSKERDVQAIFIEREKIKELINTLNTHIC
jgi:hypothetical protein